MGCLTAATRAFTIAVMTQDWTVIDLTNYLKNILETDYRLQDVTVSGELSNVSRPRSGHIYFTLKDSNATLQCVMWRSTAARLTYTPRDGDEVKVHGKISVYPAAGRYQLYADRLQLAGAGNLFLEFEALKRRLAATGLFDADRKRRLPQFPNKIALVTSPSGAAVRDMLNVLQRRWPLAEVIIAPTLVQGDAAAKQIINALRKANAEHPDVILLARGGGAIEDLWCFNNEDLAHAIAQSPAPIVSGVGHETDFTIADFVADQRAPTPSAAAELATPNHSDLRLALDQQVETMQRLILDQLERKRLELRSVDASLQAFAPHNMIVYSREQIRNLDRRLSAAAQHNLKLAQLRLKQQAAALETLSPLRTLERGYAVIQKRTDQQLVRTAADVNLQDVLDIRLQTGTLTVSVDDKSPE